MYIIENTLISITKNNPKMVDYHMMFYFTLISFTRSTCEINNAHNPHKAYLPHSKTMQMQIQIVLSPDNVEVITVILP